MEALPSLAVMAAWAGRLAIGTAAVGGALLAAVIAIALVVHFYYWWGGGKGAPGQHFGVINRLPGRLAIPVLGNVWEFGDPTDYSVKFMEMVADHGKNGVIRTWLGVFPVVEIFEPDLVQEEHGSHATATASSKHMEKAGLYSLLVPWLGTGLLISSGNKWKSRRRLITPAFHFGILKNFATIMNERTNVLLQLLEDKAKSGEPFNVSPFITKLTLDIICETAMGKHLDAQLKGETVPYVKAVYRMAHAVVRRVDNPLLMSDILFHMTVMGAHWRADLRTLHGFVFDVIRERRQRLTGADGKIYVDEKRPAFLDLLLSSTDEDGQALSDEALEEETATFMFEGHDTTSVALSWALWTIGQEHHVQSELQREIDAYMDSIGTSDLTEALGKRSDGGSQEDLNHLEYLDRFCKEALRLYPSVPFIMRTLSEDTNIRGVTVPKDTMVMIQILPMQRHPKFWAEPLKFDPDRWLPEQQEGRHPFVYIPFSAGSRNCIGQRFASMEEKIVLAKIIRHYHITTKDTSVKGQPELVYRPHKPVMLTMRKRRPFSAEELEAKQ